MQRQNIKICGLTSRESVETCISETCGFTGFIAHSPSPRHLTPEQMSALTPLLPSTTRSVLVTVDASDDMLATYITAASPSYLQLHGDESPERCHALKNRFGLPIIKAFGVATIDDILAISFYNQAVDMFLLDTKLPDGTSGGTGAVFDWSLLQHFITPLPWFLSGGIGIHNVKDALTSTHTLFLDVSSSLELSKGMKDISKIRDFMKQIDTL